MSDWAIVSVASAATVSAVVWARAYTAVRLASIRASKASTPQEFVMMERAAALPTGRRIQIRRKKTQSAPIPYGL